MNGADRLQTVRGLYTAYESVDSGAAEMLLTDHFTFSAPPDVGIDRAAEIFGFDGDRISSVEVYFGWDIE